MHTLIAGTTGSGKTTLATQLVPQYAAAGVYSIVLDPLKDPRWRTPYVTDDPSEFTRWAASSRRCMLFVDESGETIGHYQDQMFWLATRSRHLGHLSHFLTQRPAQVSPTVRNQCSRLYLFGVTFDDARSIAADWARSPADKETILLAGSLRPGEYFYVTRFEPPVRGSIDLGA